MQATLERKPKAWEDISQAQQTELIQIEWEFCRNDPLLWLSKFAYTCDQHDSVQPIKPFPMRPHIIEITKLWLDNPLIVLVKSRQMIQTWLFSALALWDALFHRGRLIMLQSKREEDAIGDPISGDGLLGRAQFILNHMPGTIRTRADQLVFPDGTSCYMRSKKVTFPQNNSTLWAVPQGADIIRQRTASGILSDEAAFQEEFGDAYVAARPCIRGGGWFVALSTANPGFFQKLYEDTVREDE